MNLKDLNNKRVMHIDTSKRFKQKGNTGIAFKIVETNFHRGLGLSNKLKRELDRDLNCQEDYAMLYAICIFYLIQNNLDDFDLLIICNDESYVYVKEYLDILFKDNKYYSKKEITSLSKFRKLTGNKNLRSYADNIANTYRRKIFLNKQRRQRGIPLNIVKINYKMIVEKWKEIIKYLKKDVSG